MDSIGQDLYLHRSKTPSCVQHCALHMTYSRCTGCMYRPGDAALQRICAECTTFTRRTLPGHRDVHSTCTTVHSQPGGWRTSRVVTGRSSVGSCSQHRASMQDDDGDNHDDGEDDDDGGDEEDEEEDKDKNEEKAVDPATLVYMQLCIIACDV